MSGTFGYREGPAHIQTRHLLNEKVNSSHLQHPCSLRSPEKSICLSHNHPLPSLSLKNFIGRAGLCVSVVASARVSSSMIFPPCDKVMVIGIPFSIIKNGAKRESPIKHLVYNKFYLFFNNSNHIVDSQYATLFNVKKPFDYLEITCYRRSYRLLEYGHLQKGRCLMGYNAMGELFL